MIRRISLAATLAAVALVSIGATRAPAAECELEPRYRCFGIASVDASTSTTQAGDHPDLTLRVAVKQNPETLPNAFGLKDSYATVRNLRFDVPPGLIGDLNVLGAPQQCAIEELVGQRLCPNGSQVGIATLAVYQTSINIKLREPVYMMQPPGGDAVARLGMVAGIFPTFVDFFVRSEGDYGLTAEVREAPTGARLVDLESTFWGVPADKSHDNERCTPVEALFGCVTSESRPPGSRPLPFLTNPTRCGSQLSMAVNATSWLEPQFTSAREVKAPFPAITGCDRVPFAPGLTVVPTDPSAGAPTGLDVTIRAPASDGVNVLEPSHIRDIKITLPAGLAVNAAVGDGVATCSVEEVHFKERVSAECPDAAKLAAAEFDIPVLPRRMQGAIYLREPEPGNPFRIWVVADDLGVHVKLPGQLHVDKGTGQIESIVLDAPQAPVREVKLLFKSGFRAPLVNPSACGTFETDYEFTPWSGGLPAIGSTPMTIDEGCDTGGFDPRLTAGPTDAQGGAFSPFVFTIARRDGEQNPRGLEIALPAGLTASFAGIPRCEGAAAESGQCPAGARIGKVIAAVGAGSAPLWVPQPGKRPTAVYLSGPYKGAPLSIVAVVPRQAGPFDFGDEVVRSAIYVDPETARATAVADPLPQLIEGIPIPYRTIHVALDRPHFSLNPTSCAGKETTARITSDRGAVATASSPFSAVNCATLGFRPRLGLKLRGGTGRGAHPALRAVFRPRSGDANAKGIQVKLPRSAFLDQAHIRTICTRVQYAAGEGHGSGCPAGSIYGHVKAVTPLLDEPLEGPVFLRSSNHNLPDMVLALQGPPSLPIQIEAIGRIDSVKGGIRSSFEALPDAPLSSVVLDMHGGRKGLIVNSRNLCAKPARADVSLGAQNGKARRIHSPVRAACRGTGRSGHRRG